MKLRRERLDLLHQFLGEIMPADDGPCRDVVDRLFRIELGTLATRAIQDIDEMAFEIVEAKFKHREQADRPGANDHNIGFDNLTHRKFLMPERSACRAENKGIMAGTSEHHTTLKGRTG